MKLPTPILFQDRRVFLGVRTYVRREGERVPLHMNPTHKCVRRKLSPHIGGHDVSLDRQKIALAKQRLRPAGNVAQVT